MFRRWKQERKYYEMCCFLRVGAIELLCLFLVAAERPKFRVDYKYEKAFNAFYKLHQSATSWQEARIRCQAEGAELLVPDTLDEADSVPILVTSILNRYEGIFVGIHDLYSERSFVTLKGAAMLVSILNLLWEYKQPLHSAGRCVAMRRTGRLFVHPCNRSLPFMCKVAAETIEYREECNTFDPNWETGHNKSDSCYFMHLEPQKWQQAYATCLSAGGHLAIINDRWEADHLKHMFKHTDSRRIPDNDFAFLGFSDLFQRHHYRTVHGERVEDLNYRDWEQQGCSRNANVSYADFRCGGFRRTGLLSKWDCEIPAMFFCEKPANATLMKNVMREGVTVSEDEKSTRHDHHESHELIHDLT